MRLRPFLTLLVTATAATASSVRDEAVVNTVQPTAANPRSSSFTDSLNGSIDLSNEWTLNLGGSLTMQGRTPASQRGQFPESASVVTVLSAGADWIVVGRPITGAADPAGAAATLFGTSRSGP